MRESLQNRIILVTGGSSGIGRALVLALAKRGNIVYATGRNEEALAAVKKNSPGKIKTLVFDITDRQGTLDAMKKIEADEGKLDIAVINAGTCEYLDIKNWDTALIERVLRTNLWGFVYCVEAALPLLRKGNRPYLVGMSSSAGYFGLPRAEAYGASKAAVRYFLQSIRVDLAPEGIDVSVVCPGFVKTPLTDRNDFPMPMLITIEKAVDYIISGMEKRKHEIHFPFIFTFSLKLFSILPSRWRHYFIKRMVRKS